MKREVVGVIYIDNLNNIEWNVLMMEIMMNSAHQKPLKLTNAIFHVNGLILGTKFLIKWDNWVKKKKKRGTNYMVDILYYCTKWQPS